MKKTNTLISLILVLSFPLGVFALSAPTVETIPNQVDADFYTLIIQAPVGSTVSVVGGPSNIAPVTDGAGSDALDGKVEVLIGLAQEQVNVFSISVSKDGEFSDSVVVSINESSASQGLQSPGDHTPPPAPTIDPIDNPVAAYEYRLAGSAEADANIYVKRPDGSIVGSTRANSNGIFEVTVDLEIGKTNRFNISAEDAAYNIGPSIQAVIQAIEPSFPEPEESVEEEEPTSESQVSELPFIDTKGHWAEDYIRQLYEDGVVSGKTSDLFEPNALITRAELVKIVVNVFGYAVNEAVEERPFPDVLRGTWFAPYVEAAKREAITGGFPDGTFQPHKSVNRASALKMLVVASGLDYLDSPVNFTDVKESDWFAGFVGFAQQNDIAGGYEDGSFRPGNLITRAEVVKIAVKLLELTE